MKRFLLLLLAFPGTLCASEFFVAPGGNDGNPGTRSKPFATFERGQRAVRAERQAHPGEAVTVTFRRGIYTLGRTLEFTAADSGASEQNPVRYVAEPGREVVIRGGQTITRWQRDPQRPGVWKAKVDPTLGRFEQLWVNGRRAIRARTPDYWDFGSLVGIAEEPGKNGVEAVHTFTVRPERLGRLQGMDSATLRQVQVVVFHKWDTTREWLQSASPTEGTFVAQGAKMASWNPMERDSMFYLENFLGALDSPGEWFLDQDGWVYYQPREGENMKKAEVIAPQLERFMAIKGGEAEAQRVRHLQFQGLKFRYAELHVPPAGLPAGQACMNIDATAIQLDGAEGIRFSDCAVENIGPTAFWFRHACRDCVVEHTRMFDLGIGGVRIGEPTIVPEPVRTSHITVRNCILQSGGRIMPHTVAVWIGHSPDNTIEHCDIGDWFYTAISVGWRWGYDESAAKRNRIAFNHLHHLGYRILSDMGGVYTLGPSEGTVVCNNVIHDVYANRYGGWGLYPDEGSTGILFANNLVYDVRDGCVHQHYGKENIFTNNILAFSEEGQIAVTRAEPHLSFTFERNIVYYDQGKLLGYNGWKSGAKVVLKNNVYFRAGGRPVEFEGKDLKQWKGTGKDDGSIVADPMFADPAKRDFHLLPGSPAVKLGFQPFDYTLAGVSGDDGWKRLASCLVCPPPCEVPGAEPISVHDDFEKGRITPLLSVATLVHEGHPELIAVTGSLAAGGRRCLKIQDRPDLQAFFDPHFYLDPHYTRGAATLTFKIRVEPGSIVNCDWRDASEPFLTGPTLRIEEGSLSCRDRKLLAFPGNGWVAVEMRSPIGQADSKWSLKVTLPDGSTRSFNDLPSDQNWKSLRWLGFSSVSKNSAAFYLDDFALDNK